MHTARTLRAFTGRTHRAILRVTFAAMCCLAALPACTGTTDPDNTKSITQLNGPAAAVSVGQGFSTKTIISIKRSSAFDGVVQLSADGMPQGLLVSFAPATLSSTAELSEMTISALSTVAPGAHTITVRASGEGVATRTLAVLVMVTVPTISVTASTSVSVAQGSTQNIPITIARDGGFTGIVGLSVLGLPAGVTATFAPPVIESGATTSTLTLSAPLTVQTGLTNITLRASAQGLADKTVPMQLTVGPATSAAILLSASPAFVEVVSGQTVETVLTLQRFAGFTGAVDVTVDGLPVQLTTTADPFAPGSNTTTLRITARQEPPGSPYLGGTHQLSVRATGQGVQQAAVGVAVTVGLQARFNLFFSGGNQQTVTQVTLTRGANVSVGMGVSRFVFSQPIAMTITGLPAGVTTNLPLTIPASTEAQSFAVELSATANTVPGVYNLVIRGESAPAPARTATILLTVN
jgi:hypothetical protein